MFDNWNEILRNQPGWMRPDSDAGPRCSRSLTKIPSRMLPQTLKPRPVKSRLFKPTMLTRLAFGWNDELKKIMLLLCFSMHLCLWLFYHFFFFFPHLYVQVRGVRLHPRDYARNYTIRLGFRTWGSREWWEDVVCFCRMTMASSSWLYTIHSFRFIYNVRGGINRTLNRVWTI